MTKEKMSLAVAYALTNNVDAEVYDKADDNDPIKSLITEAVNYITDTEKLFEDVKEAHLRAPDWLDTAKAEVVITNDFARQTYTVSIETENAHGFCDTIRTPILGGYEDVVREAHELLEDLQAYSLECDYDLTVVPKIDLD